MSKQLLTILKLCVVAMLYLFFFRVLRAVWVEIKPPAGAAGFIDAPTRRARRKAKQAQKKSKKAQRRPVRPPARRSAPSALVVVEPPDRRGERHVIGEGLTVGRAAGCQITVDDTYVSQMHSKVSQRNGDFMVEDLGSTNGTYLNGTKVSGTMVIRRGDKLKIGNTVLELT